MKILPNYDLKNLNTFGIAAKAKFFTEVQNESELTELFQSKEFKDNIKLFLGGGSNVLISGDFDGIVILNKLKGISILSEDKESVTIRSMSGEVWHDLVTFVVERGLWGVENLAFIPGTVGAAPMQNIGAYGVELKKTLESVEAIHIETGGKKIFGREECNFGYRDSIFKRQMKGKYFISAITLRLSKIPNPQVQYKHLKEYLENNKIDAKSSKDISDAVTAIRKSKLPDPTVIPNAGSFFKNVFLPREQLEEIKKKYPDLPYFEEGGIMKIPAAWLIEQSGPASGTSWKGHRAGNVGVHDKHALVLVNHGGGSGEELKKLSEDIIESVYAKFGILLQPEVNLI
jgi:UDP-N-acetylmuramate dehydrogenase